MVLLRIRSLALSIDLLVIGVARCAERALWRGMDGAAADFAVAACGACDAFALLKK